MFSDRRYPCFRNFNSAVFIDVIRMKSNLDSLFDPILITSIETAELKFLEHGYLRSGNTIAVQLESGHLREHHLLVGITMRNEMHQRA